jgi:large subunit ribosomal protein L28
VTRNISSNRSKRGLYDLKDIRSGNNVPFSLKKTKRKFKPNVFKKRLYSEILDEMIQFHATTSAIRTIDKLGGLDNYLLTSGEDKVKKGSEGWVVRQRILQKIENCNKLGEPVLKDINLSKTKKEFIQEEKNGKLLDENA